MRTLHVALAIVLACGSTALGHHSFAAHYFEEQSVTIQGTLVEFDYPKKLWAKA